MRIELVEVWQNRGLFEIRLMDKIKGIEQYYEIIDIKYSTFYDSLNKQHNYSALILFKEKGE
jgi:hypothetical protein